LEYLFNYASFFNSIKIMIRVFILVSFDVDPVRHEMDRNAPVSTRVREGGGEEGAAARERAERDGVLI